MNKQRTAEGVIALLAGFAAFAMFFLFLQEASAQPPNKEPPVADTPGQVQGQVQTQGQTQEATANSDSISTATANSDATSDATADVSVQGGGASTGDYVNISEHTFYSYAQSDRPANGCFISADGARGERRTFSALSIYWLNTNCWMDTLARGERDVVINAELKCYARKYRNALTWDMKGNKRERTARCVEKASRSGLAMIEQERQAMQREIDAANKRHSDVENLLVIEQEHKQVCDESLERCEEKAYGEK